MYLKIFFTVHLVLPCLAIYSPSTHPSEKLHLRDRSWSLTRSLCVLLRLFGEWEGGPVNQVNYTSWVAVVTPTDRPKSVRNRCLIELFCGVVCVVTLPF